jgi:hypothetical protein
MHCFVKFQRLDRLWEWISNVLHTSCPWIKDLTEAKLLFGYSELHADDKHQKIWKLFHAKLIRVIWYSRCRKVFEDEVFHIQALQNCDDCARISLAGTLDS